jgi:outer membrane protein assembly factor BamB
MISESGSIFGVVPVVIGPLQVLIAVLPAILSTLFGAIIALLKPKSLKVALRVLWRNKLGTAITIAIIAGLWYGTGYLRQYFRGKAKSAEAVSTEWSVYRGSADRRGVVHDNKGEPNGGGIIWKFTEAPKFYSSPAVVGNRVFVCSADYRPLRDRGSIFCIDADTGVKVWEYSPRGFRATYSSPSISKDGYLVCGEGLHFTRDARITCLKVNLKENKYEFLWEYRTKSHVESSPCIYNGKVYVGAGDDGLYCIALDPMPDKRPKVIWHADPKEYPDCETSPVVVDGHVFFGLGMGGKAIVCLDAETGKLVWKKSTPYPVFSHPAVVEGKVVAGMGNGNVAETAEEVWSKEQQKLKARGASEKEIQEAAKLYAPGGEVWCLDAKDGSVLWTYKTKAVVIGAVAVSDGKAYFADQSGMITCLSLADGKLVANRNVHQPIVTSPAVGNEYVYVTSSSGKLFCLDKKTLNLVWEANTGLGNQNWSSPCVARGHVYVGTEQNGLICIGEVLKGTKVDLWAGALGGPGKSGLVDSSSPPAWLTFAWRYPVAEEAEEGEELSSQVVFPPALMGGNIYVGIKGKQTGIAKLKLAEKRSTKPAEEWFKPAEIVSPIAIRNKEVIFTTEVTSTNVERALVCLDADSGNLVWQHKIAPSATGEFTLSKEGILVADIENGISFLSSGRSITNEWSAIIGKTLGAPISIHKIVITAVQTNQLYALSLINGSELWRVSVDSSITTGPVVSGEHIAIGTESGISVHSLVNGSKLWSTNYEGTTIRLVCDDTHLVGVTKENAIFVFDWNGSLITKITDIKVGTLPMLCDDSVLYFSDTSITLVNLHTRVKKNIAGNLGWLGTITTPAIMAESHLYFGTANKGLICMRPK